MGRLGKLPVELPQNVKAEVNGSSVVIEGTKGSLNRSFSGPIIIKMTDEGVLIDKKGNTQASRALQGSVRAHVLNMIKGVSEGWKKQLEISGPGYRAEARGKEIVLSVGYSHPVIITAPEGISFQVEKNIITVEGSDKEKVGQTAALIRDSRRASPYTGSGVKYVDEVVRRKAGKQAGKTE